MDTTSLLFFKIDLNPYYDNGILERNRTVLYYMFIENKLMNYRIKINFGES